MVLDPIEPGAHNAPEPFRGSLAGKVWASEVWSSRRCGRLPRFIIGCYPHPPSQPPTGVSASGFDIFGRPGMAALVQHCINCFEQCFLIDSASILSDRRAESRFDGTMEPAAIGIGWRVANGVESGVDQILP